MTNMIMVQHNNVASWCYAVGCVLTHGILGLDMARDGPNQIQETSIEFGTCTLIHEHLLSKVP